QAEDGIRDLTVTGVQTCALPIFPQWIMIQLRINRSEGRAFELIGILTNPPTPVVLEVHHEAKLVAIDPIFVVNVAGRIGQGNCFPAQRNQLVDGVLRYVPTAGNQAGLTLKIFLPRLEHLRGEINRAIASSFRPDNRAAPHKSLSGYDA